MDTRQAPIIPCLLSEKAVYTIRQYIFYGTKAFANRAMDHTWLKNKFGPSFEDIEIAISAEGYTCEKAPMLRPDEYATFIRIKETWSETAVSENTTPRVLTVGLVFSLTGRPHCPAVCRLWEECPRRWVGGNGDKPLAILNDEVEMSKIISEMIAGYQFACTKPLSELADQQDIDGDLYSMGSNATSGVVSGGSNASSGATVPTPLLCDDMPALEEE
jgi:hypothetical protein